MFAEELAFFIKHQEELVANHRGKILVLKGQELLGTYDSPLEAYQETVKDHEPGTFMIQPSEPGDGAYTVFVASGAFSPPSGRGKEATPKE